MTDPLAIFFIALLGGVGGLMALLLIGKFIRDYVVPIIAGWFGFNLWRP